MSNIWCPVRESNSPNSLRRRAARSTRQGIEKARPKPRFILLLTTYLEKTSTTSAGVPYIMLNTTATTTTTTQNHLFLKISISLILIMD